MEKLNVLILGAGGRLGAALARAYDKDFCVTALGRKDADLSQPDKVKRIVGESGADVVINCAAITNVDLCETERELAELVNATAPGVLAEAAAASGARFVHISTDYVFSGLKDHPYTEEDTPDPASWYGETKKRGDDLVLAADARNAVVRVAWVFGPDRDSFLDKALQTAARGEQVRAVADKYSSPTYTLDAAAALRALINADAPGGIYHVCNSGICSWQEWAQHGIDSAIRQGAAIKPQEVAAIKLCDIKAMKAPRPVFSAMSCRKIESLLGHEMRSWRCAVDEYLGLLLEVDRI